LPNDKNAIFYGGLDVKAIQALKDWTRFSTLQVTSV